MPDKDIDRREEILLSVFNKYKQDNPAENWASWDSIKSDGTAKITYGAMDEYMKECLLELLEYVAKKIETVTYAEHSGAWFISRSGQILSKEELFENFL